MAFILGGTTIPELTTAGNVMLGGVSVDRLILAGELVWSRQIVGDVVIDYNGITGTNPETVTGSNGAFTFTAPAKVTSITICMAGGGGGGSTFETGFTTYGGHAGQLQQQVITITSAEVIPVTIGGGGQGGQAPSVLQPSAGGDSVMKGFTATGGLPGYEASVNTALTYVGNGAPVVSPCDGATYTDGTTRINGSETAHGGAAGPFGNGGFGSSESTDAPVVPPGHGGISAGGGATNPFFGSGTVNNTLAGNGGAGRCVITWDVSL